MLNVALHVKGSEDSHHRQDSHLASVYICATLTTAGMAEPTGLFCLVMAIHKTEKQVLVKRTNPVCLFRYII